LSDSKLVIRPLSGAIGAQIDGIDLSRSLDDHTVSAIREAWLEHLMIVFRDQTLTPEQQLRFARYMGTPAEYPFVQGLPEYPEITPVVKLEHETTNFGGIWHSDTTYLQAPPTATLLLARELPPSGGDTLFANMYLAYETLSDGMKELLEGLDAENESGPPEKYSNRYQSMEELRKNDALGATHPVVRVHPATGRKSLFVSLAFTKRFKGMTDEESAPLLEFLYHHSTQAHLGCRLQWQKGSLALWDNRVSLHHAVSDYFGEVAKHRRIMQRATIEGEVPIAARLARPKAA
jgi:taurine dioxygenase